MARRHDLVGLTVLALLTVHPSHPYELHRFIVSTHKDYITGLPRSLYHAVERLARDELIVPTGTDREGRRPERTVYEITEEGREELLSRLRQLLESPDPDRRAFVAAISLIGCLPRQEALRALRVRAATIEGTLAGMRAHMSAQTHSGLPAILMLEVELEHALNAAELGWIKDLIDRVDKGALDWAPDPPPM
ncbi:PadR family transcriptional regulator [Nonomuraea zeae]|uniref:PadR family transcriptional regulator n=1 Tax=Nonomuraea zeae TaxID=1642303 RepID=A0A5S4G0I7_9ACTN|nr:PadR family transcriptional regulator [Nonomuraea zeae]TMR26557.1 PadR family transcriptional regulator [Nonomuraea zeae]